MLIDAHAHMWNRRMLPDLAVRNYMSPVLDIPEEERKKYGSLLDFDLESNVPFADYDVKVEEPLETIRDNDMDYMVILGTDFELIGPGRMTNEEYMEWMFERCTVDDRFLPFISVDPNRGKESIDMIERLVKRYDPKGIKVYPATGFLPSDVKLKGYWDKIDDLGLTVVTHAGMALPPLDEKYCHPSDFSKVAEDHPEMNIIIAHLGGKFHSELLPLMEKHGNIYTDCSALQGWAYDDRSMICKRIKAVSSRFPDRIVFGTDFPLYESTFSAMQFIREIRDGDWGTEYQKSALLGKNMARLLGL